MDMYVLANFQSIYSSGVSLVEVRVIVPQSLYVLPLLQAHTPTF